MRGLLGLILCGAGLFPAGLAKADQPPIAPAFRAADLVAIGHVSSRPPAPGAGTGLGGCTGTLVAPTLLVTAAHCAAGRVDAPQDLYITFGWSSSGPPLWRGTASAIFVHPDYVPGRYEIETLSYDLAFVRLPRPVPAELVPPIPLAPGQTAETYESYGYLAQSDTLLRGHDGCRVAQITPARLWGFDCDVVSGFSGGPLLAQTDAGPVVAGVAVAHAPGRRDGIRSFAALPDLRDFPEDLYPD